MSLRQGIAVVVFEGGGCADSPLESDLLRIREAITLDTVQRLAAAPLLDEVVLVTDRSALAGEARLMGATVVAGPEEFHFGLCLKRLVHAGAWNGVMVMGGAAAPLLLPADFAGVARLLRERERVAVLNNPQSPDLVAFAPAEVLDIVEPVASDNELGQALVAAGLPRVLMESSPRISFDLDTPTDCALLAGEGEVGPRTRRALASCSWLDPLRERLEGVVRVLARDMGEVALIGRVGPPVTAFLNAHLRCRLRVFSEERGMRALGREREGRVTSLIGALLDEVGPERFFTLLGDIAEAALFDTRVLMASWRRPLSASDRFHSDVGAVQEIVDPVLRRFTAAALAAPVPVALGGHSLVHGGLWLLGQRAAQAAAARTVP